MLYQTQYSNGLLCHLANGWLFLDALVARSIAVASAVSERCEEGGVLGASQAEGLLSTVAGRTFSSPHMQK
jgi:hypothetical protein